MVNLVYVGRFYFLIIRLYIEKWVEYRFKPITKGYWEDNCQFNTILKIMDSTCADSIEKVRGGNYPLIKWYPASL